MSTVRLTAEAHPLSLTRLGWGVAAPVGFLCILGLATIHATERDELRDRARVEAGGEPNPVLRLVQAIGPATLRQCVWMCVGVAGMLGVLVPSYTRIGRLATVVYWAVIALLVWLVADRFLNRIGVDLPFSPVRRNTRRWIEVGGLGVQPSELMKVALVLLLAHYLRFRSSYRRWSGLLPPFLLTLLPMGLIHFQPDLGTLIMLLPVLFAMLFVAGARLRHLATIVVLGISVLPLFYFFGMERYQRQRIDVLLKQDVGDENWQMNEGYQLRQSKLALGTGGAWGEGWRQGMFIEHELLPEEHNDFIFAIIGHQWGYAGCLAAMAAYAVIVLCGVEVAVVTNDPFGRLLAVGVIVMIVAQALLNIGMNIGLTPITGMPLPFVSAGGSSLLANFTAVGLLVNVAQRRPMRIANPPFEHRD